MKRSCSLALGIIAFVWLAAGSACAQTEKCQAAKMKAAGKKAGCLLKVRSKSAAKAVLVDTAKVTACETKFSGAFTKAESKPPCSTTGDASAIESKVDRFVKEIAAELALSPPSKCQGAKLKAAGKAASCRLGAEAKGLVKNIPPDLSKCATKFSAAWTKAETQTDCGPATGDMAAIDAKLAALEDDVACEEDAGPACTCGTPAPARLAFTTSIPSGPPCGSTVSSSGSPLATLACNLLYTGGGNSGVAPSTIADYGTTITKVSCCRSKFLTLSAASSTDTGSNGNCSDANCLYGAPLPIVTGIPVCIINTVAQPAAGYMYCDVGSETLDIPLSSDIHIQFDLFVQTTTTSQCTGSGTDSCCTGSGTGSCRFDNSQCTGSGTDSCCTGSGAGSCTGCAISQCTGSGTDSCCTGAGTGSCGFANSQCTAAGTDTCCTGAGTGSCVADHCEGGTNAGTCCTMNSDCTGGGFCSAGVQSCPICAGGLCHGGANNGNACTPGQLLTMGPQWPTSQDCPPGGESPSIGSLPIPYLLTTGTVTKTAVDEPMGQARVFCGFCSDPSSASFKNPGVPCTSDGECAGFTTGCGGGGNQPCTACKQRSSGAFGAGAARTITENGAPTGAIATGDPLKSETLVSVFCIPPTFTAVDGSGDLPGPGAASIQGQTQLLP